MTTLAPVSGELRESLAPSSPWRGWVLAVLVVCVVMCGVGLRFARLGVESLWFDEGYTAWVVSLPPHEIVRAIRVDTAPPLHYLLLHEWTLVFGRSEAALRAVSALCSAGALVLCGLTARRLLGSGWAALAAMALEAPAYMPVAFAHEARFYAMMMLLGAAGFYLVLLLVERASVPRLALLAACWAASLYTNNVMVLYVAASAAAWVMLPGRVPRWRRVRHLAAVGAIAVAAFMPWAPNVLRQHRAIGGNFWLSPPTSRDLADTVSALFGVHARQFRFERTIAVSIVVLVFAGGVAALTRRRWRMTMAALGLVAFGPMVVMFLLSLVSQPIFIGRVLLPSCAFTPILMASPLAWLWKGRARVLWGICLALLVVVEIQSLRGQWLGEHLEGWRAAIRFVQSQRKRVEGRSVVVFSANEGEMLYDYYARDGDYSRRADLVGVPADYFVPPGGGPPRTMRRVHSDADLAALAALLERGQFDHLFFVQSHQLWGDPEHRVMTMLLEKLPLERREDFVGINVFEFDASDN